MKKESILVLLLLTCCLMVHATVSLPDGDKTDHTSATETKSATNKTWEFYSSITQLTADELAEEANYKFGSEAGCLYNRFMEIYVVREEVVPGDPTRRTVIRKPAIYNAVRSVEKQLSKEIKSNRLDKEKAATEFTQILKIALSAIDSDTQSFENELQKSRKDANDLLALFKNVRLIHI